MLLFVELHAVLQNDPKKLCGRISYPVFQSFRTCELNLPSLFFTGATSIMESLDKWNYKEGLSENGVPPQASLQ